MRHQIKLKRSYDQPVGAAVSPLLIASASASVSRIVVEVTKRVNSAPVSGIGVRKEALSNMTWSTLTSPQHCQQRQWRTHRESAAVALRIDDEYTRLQRCRKRAWLEAMRVKQARKPQQPQWDDQQVLAGDEKATRRRHRPRRRKNRPGAST